MEPSFAANQAADANQAARRQLQQVRNTVLALHKALLDSERTAYEITHGPVGSPGAFLQLLINDPWFAWLQPMTNLIVLIDETLAAKNPLAETSVLEQLLADTRALLSPSTESSNGFWKRYSGALQRDPGVAVLHSQVTAELPAR
ncbi:MAG TPA: hypothetical protein VH351_22005 [Bryobacteraceae bacterium]|jgi:hypothetical protein|nr:hypothetical protein [Bryobacteraceae bacterium]